LGRHMAATAVAEPVIKTAGAVTIDFRVNGRRALEGLPAELPGSVAHQVGEAGAAQTGHRIGAGARAFKLVASGYNFAVDVAGIAGNPQRVLYAIIERLQLFVAEGPVLDGRVLRNPVGTVAIGGFADHLEIPGVQAPALGPVVHRGATYPIHHGMSAPLYGL